MHGLRRPIPQDKEELPCEGFRNATTAAGKCAYIRKHCEEGGRTRASPVSEVVVRALGGWGGWGGVRGRGQVDCGASLRPALAYADRGAVGAAENVLLQRRA